MITLPRRRTRTIRLILYTIFTVLFLDSILSFQSSYPQLNKTQTHSAHELTGIKSVYIASTQWNSGTMLQDHWIPTLLQVVKELKAADISVFVSIYENGSWDDTKSILQQLRLTLEALDVQYEIVVDDTSHEQIIADARSRNASDSGWLRTAYGREMRRISYLAGVRNEALKPLARLNGDGVRFDRILYINDVIFSVADVMTLLNTRKGNYAAACALDFLNPPWNWIDAKSRGFHPAGIYDDFATRDSSGNRLGSHLYPYFSSHPSRNAVMSGQDIPVQSCWNGIVAFDAAPFQSPSTPLRFRSIPDSLAQYHVEASECCTIHYDNPLSSVRGVWINPAVRVGYSAAAYDAVSRKWPTASELRWGYWSSKWLWWLRDPGSPLKTWYRVRHWRRKNPTIVEPGLACASDLAMVLTANGWAMRGARFE